MNRDGEKRDRPSLNCPFCGEPLLTYDTLYCFEGRTVACEFCIWERFFLWRRAHGRPAAAVPFCSGGGRDG